jgi:hypothetical protein
LAQNVIVYALQVEPMDRSVVKIRQLTQFHVESPIASFGLVRNGFALLATRDGALAALIEHEKAAVRSLRAVANETIRLLAIEPGGSAIVESEVLELFRCLPESLQEEVVANSQVSGQTAAMLLGGLSEQASRLCSTI